MKNAQHHSGGGSDCCAGQPSDLLRIADVVRERFRLGRAHPVVVQQLHTVERGFPPFETRIVFWTGNSAEHRYRVFKGADIVSSDDLPPWWMKDALIIDDYPHCDCCG